MQQNTISQAGRKFKSRQLTNRDKQQHEFNIPAAKEVHHGSKNDFILGFAHSVCSSKTSSPLTSTPST